MKRNFIKTTIHEYLSENTINSDDVDIWYHGTDSEFDEFNLSNFGKTDDGWYGIGVYVHSDIETAKIYGKNVIQAFFDTNKILNLPKKYPGEFLYKKLTQLGLDLPKEYSDYSPNKIIRSIGKKDFSEFIKNHFDVMIINYTQGTKEAVVFNPKIIKIIK